MLDYCQSVIDCQHLGLQIRNLIPPPLLIVACGAGACIIIAWTILLGHPFAGLCVNLCFCLHCRPWQQTASIPSRAVTSCVEKRTLHLLFRHYQIKTSEPKRRRSSTSCKSALCLSYGLGLAECENVLHKKPEGILDRAASFGGHLHMSQLLAVSRLNTFQSCNHLFGKDKNARQTILISERLRSG